jgi:membrane protease YdiL (CAAX protease family)
MPPFGLVSSTLAAAILGYLVLVVPTLGWRTFRRLRAGPDIGPQGRIRVYRRAVVRHGCLALLTVAFLIVSRSAKAEQLGLALPRGPHVAEAAAVGGAFVLLLVAPLLWRVPDPGLGQGSPGWAIVARTTAELAWAAGFALAAGVGEELLMRGLFFAIGLSMGASVTAVWWWGAVVFGLQHSYQGFAGMLFAAVLGGLFGWLYLITGSLLIPVGVHVLVDLRALVLVPVLLIRSRRAMPGSDLRMP